MLFNTFAFFLVFLPIALAGYFFLSKFSIRLSIGFLLIASVVFYIYWNVAFLPLLLGSVATNYAVGRWITRKKEAGNTRGAKLALILGLTFNLGLLGIFKYLDFVIANVVWLTGADIKPLGIVLPIGISFFTFTQIAYLVDCRSAQVREYKPENYGLFVTYFPHLIAGPILHHKDMIPQFDRADSHLLVPGRLVIGTMFFAIGLFKKVILADGVARFVAPVFDVSPEQLTMMEAWSGALAYTFQIYFDFSAYSDMAYGLSYMFGIVLPINFNSPYKAGSIIDFWRRWHMTLSAFLRDYLYIPLGGNRHGRRRRYFNLFATMLLGGLWHGANWTFVIWGGLHGVYLVINHMLRLMLGDRRSRALAPLGWLTTFFAVVVAWVFFRAASLTIALDVIRAMGMGTYAGGAAGGGLGINRIMAVDECAVWLVALAAIAFLAPNAYEMIGRGLRTVQEARLKGGWGGVALGAILVTTILLLSIGETRGVSEFLYFNF
jgi:alginate O-acetyltransferase complex protein AlgI